MTNYQMKYGGLYICPVLMPDLSCVGNYLSIPHSLAKPDPFYRETYITPCKLITFLNST